MNDTIQGLLILIPVLLLSMSIHEMMHAYTSHWLGDDTAHSMGRVTINPLKHIDPFFTIALPAILLITGSPFLFGAAKPVQVNFSRLKYGEFGGAIVGMIGPLTNLVIAVIVAVLFNNLNPTYGTTIYQVFSITIMLNVGLFVFNSIPWPPLDGSRLLYAFAPAPLQRIMESIESMGMMGLLVFIFLFYSLGGTVGVVMTKLVNVLAPTLIV